MLSRIIQSNFKTSNHAFLLSSSSYLNNYSNIHTINNHQTSKHQLSTLQRNKLTDRSFRLANVTDLAIAQQYKSQIKQDNYPMFVHTTHLKPRAIEKQVVIDLSHAHGYKRGHIPSAINLGLERFDFSRLIDSPLDSNSITYEEIHHLLNDTLGINNDTSEIILYDNNGFLACRAFFVLRYFGFTNVRVLNGGWRAWLRSGLPITEKEKETIPLSSNASSSQSSQSSQSSSIKTKPFRTEIIKRPSDVFDLHKQLINNKNKKNIYFVDTRNVESYNIYHIPNAINIPCKLFMEEANFVSVQEIRDIIKKHNIQIENNEDKNDKKEYDSQIILYSDQRLSASVGYFALTMAGIDNCCVYDAGIYHWISNYETSKLSDAAIEYLQR